MHDASFSRRNAAIVAYLKRKFPEISDAAVTITPGYRGESIMRVQHTPPFKDNHYMHEVHIDVDERILGFGLAAYVGGLAHEFGHVRLKYISDSMGARKKLMKRLLIAALEGSLQRLKGLLSI